MNDVTTRQTSQTSSLVGSPTSPLVDILPSPPSTIMPPVDETANRISLIATLSGSALLEACESAATRALDAGRAVVDAANEIMRQAEQLAEAIRRSGAITAAQVDTFATMAQSVAVTMQQTRLTVQSTKEGE